MERGGGVLGAEWGNNRLQGRFSRLSVILPRHSGWRRRPATPQRTIPPVHKRLQSANKCAPALPPVGKSARPPRRWKPARRPARTGQSRRKPPGLLRLLRAEARAWRPLRLPRPAFSVPACQRRRSGRAHIPVRLCRRPQSAIPPAGNLRRQPMPRNRRRPAEPETGGKPVFRPSEPRPKTPAPFPTPPICAPCARSHKAESHNHSHLSPLAACSPHFAPQKKGLSARRL